MVFFFFLVFAFDEESCCCGLAGAFDMRLAWLVTRSAREALGPWVVGLGVVAVNKKRRQNVKCCVYLLALVPPPSPPSLASWGPVLLSRPCPPALRPRPSCWVWLDRKGRDLATSRGADLLFFSVRIPTYLRFFLFFLFPIPLFMSLSPTCDVQHAHASLGLFSLRVFFSFSVFLSSILSSLSDLRVSCLSSLLPPFLIATFFLQNNLIENTVYIQYSYVYVLCTNI